MNYIYIQSTVSVSLTTRERGAYTRMGGGGVGLYLGGLISGGKMRN